MLSINVGWGPTIPQGVDQKVSAHQWAVGRLKAHVEGRASVKADADLFRKKHNV